MDHSSLQVRVKQGERGDKDHRVIQVRADLGEKGEKGPQGSRKQGGERTQGLQVRMKQGGEGGRGERTTGLSSLSRTG